MGRKEKNSLVWHFMFPRRTLPWIFFTSTTFTNSSSMIFPRKMIWREGGREGEGGGGAS